MAETKLEHQKIVSFAFNATSYKYASLLPFPIKKSSPKTFLKSNWHDLDAVIFFSPLSIATRTVAEFIKSKDSDPAVICVDINNKLAIAILGSHRRTTFFYGANQLAKTIASILGFSAIVTTETESVQVPAIELTRNYKAEGDFKKLLSRVLNGEKYEAALDNWSHLPVGISENEGSTLIFITDRLKPQKSCPVYIRPPSLHLGIGLSTSCKPDELIAFVVKSLKKADLSQLSVASIATINIRKNHPALEQLAYYLDAPIKSFSNESLSKINVPNPSMQTQKYVSTPSVAEAAALLATKLQGKLILQKQKTKNATLAVARATSPIGKLQVVGIGPGSINQLSIHAKNALIHSEIIIGYEQYISYINPLVDYNQEVFSYAIGQEEKRATDAINLARLGYRVCVISSGDAQVFGMASMIASKVKANDCFEFEVIPGITAALSAGAILGSPLGRDFSVISLSDLHTPIEKILTKIQNAAKADMVLVLYNPVSKRRLNTYSRVLHTIRSVKPANTVIGIVKNAWRENQEVIITDLASIDNCAIDMNTIIFIGTSKTYVSESNLMITPRYDF